MVRPGRYRFRRKLAGTPQGGRFDPSYHADVATRVTPYEQDALARATFYNPPPPSSAAAAVLFSLTVALPSEYLGALEGHLADDPAVTDGIAAMVARVALLQRLARRLEASERQRTEQAGISFPNGMVFTVADALRYFLIEPHEWDPQHPHCLAFRR